MKCPHCSHESEAQLLKCRSCGEIYHGQSLEELAHVDYLLAWLDAQRNLMGEALATRLGETVQNRRETLLAVLLPAPEPSAAVPVDISPQLAILIAIKVRIPSWILSDVLSVASANRLTGYLSGVIEAEVPDIAQGAAPDIQAAGVDRRILDSLADWIDKELLTREEADRLRRLYATDAPVEAEAAPTVNQVALMAAAQALIKRIVIESGVGMMVGLVLRDDLDTQIKAADPGLRQVDIRSAMEQVSEKDIRDFVKSRLGYWVADNFLTETDAQLIAEYLRQELVLDAAPDPAKDPVMAADAAPKAAAQVQVPAPAAERAPAPVRKPTPPKPRKPIIEWDKAWEKIVEAAVSGLLLRWLRYLGAFLFVVSVAIVVVNFWNEIPQWGQVSIIFFVPTAFYVGGLVLRKKLGVVQTGGVLMGVGQILLAIDFAAIYQFGGLTVEPKTYWLLTSTICTLFYLFSVIFIVQAEFFGYIGLVGVGSTVAAGVAMMTATMDWPLVAGAGVAALSVELGYRLKSRSEKWREIAAAGLRFAQFMIPMILLFLLLLPMPNIRWAQMAGFAFATAAAGLLAVRLGQVLFTHATVWFSALTAVMLMRGFYLDWTWYPVAAGVLALFYNSVLALMRRGKEEIRDRRKPHLLPFDAGALAMLGLAVIAGMVASVEEIQAGILSLMLGASVLSVKAVTDRRPRYLAAGAVLFFIPVSQAIYEWKSADVDWVNWLSGAWAALAFIYVGLAAGFRRKDDYVRWLMLSAQSGVLLGLGVFFVDRFISQTTPTAAVVVLAGIVSFYGLSAWLYHSERHPALNDWVKDYLPAPLQPALFIWAVAILLPIWLTIFWQTTRFEPAWLAVGLAVMTLAYVGGGTVMTKIRAAYGAPFRWLPYLLALGSVIPAADDPLPLMIALLIQTAVLVSLAMLHGHWIDTAIAALVFLWPFTLAMELLRIEPQAYSIGFIALVSLVYVPLAQRLAGLRAEDGHHMPLYLTGYGLSVVAVLMSILGTFRWFGYGLLWPGVFVPLAAALLYGYSTFRVHRWFKWAAVGVLPVAFWQALLLFDVSAAWQAGAWVVFGSVYLIAGAPVKRFESWQQAFVLPLRTFAWLLAGLGMYLVLPFTVVALREGVNTIAPVRFAAPIAAYGLAAGFTVLAAILYRRRLPLILTPWLTFLPVTLMGIGYGEIWTGRWIESSEFGILWAALGAVHLLAAAVLDRFKAKRGAEKVYSSGIYLGAYVQIGLGVVWAFADPVPFLWSAGLMMATALASALIVHTGRHLAWAQLRTFLFKEKTSGLFVQVFDSLFIWAAAWMLPYWAGRFLLQLPIVSEYVLLGVVGSALFLLGVAVLLGRVKKSYAWPLYLSGQVYTALTCLLSLDFSLRVLARGAVIGQDEVLGLAVVLMQALSVLYYALFAFVFRRRMPGYVFSPVAGALLVLMYTVGLQVFGLYLFGRALQPVEFGVAWVLLAGVIVAAAVWIEQRRAPLTQGRRLRFDAFSAHGLHIVGYALADVSLLWVLAFWNQKFMGAITPTMGIWVLWMILSAWLVHQDRHMSYDDLMRVVFGESDAILKAVFRSAFLWLSAWMLPIWVTLVLWQAGVVTAFGYLGYLGTALGFLVLAVLLGRVRREYAWPFISAGQFFNLLALAQSLPMTERLVRLQRLPDAPEGVKIAAIGFVVLQAASVVYFAASSGYFRRHRKTARVFSYLASLLTWVPVTVSLIAVAFGQVVYPFAYVWLGVAAALLAVGFGLDALERRGGRERTGFAHGPYFSGYLGLICTVFWAWPDRPVWLAVSAAVFLLLLISQWSVHVRRHETWADMLGRFFGIAGESLQSGFRSTFLWAAAVLFPVWLAALLAYQDVSIAWRGMALALAAPVYIAFGLALRRVDGAYSQPMYVVGYALTAIGAMVSFEEPLLAIYVLTLDAVVYAVSAYIFRLPIWLYLTTVLTPVIAVMTLQYNLEALPAPWLTWIFMGLAYLYLAIGQVFDRKRVPGQAVHAFALPFYAPGFLLSALGLATASGDRELAIAGYLAGVVLYAFSAWRFRESVFLYPAAWLAAVPYYLGMTYTQLDVDWYGIGWLPLMVTAFTLGRLVFHRSKDRLNLAHPAMPFYILVYALSLSMLLIARGETLALAWSLSAAGVLYLFSARVFHKAFWLYPGLMAGHLAMLAFTQVDPGRYPMHQLAVLFLPVTALVSITGGWLWKRSVQLDGRGWKQAALDWAAPFLLFGVLDLVVWQIVASFSLDSAVVVAGTHAIVVGIVAVLWMSTTMVWGALGFLVLAMAFRLLALDPGIAASGAILAGTGFACYLIGRLLAEIGAGSAAGERGRQIANLWRGSVTWLGIGLNLVGFAAAIFFVLSESSLVAVTLVFVGAVGLAEAYDRRWYALGYVSVALLEFSYVLLMLRQEITQLQWYAIPAGLYLVGVAYFERKRGRSGFAMLLESLGLVAMLLTSFGQSLNDETGFWYFLLMLVESVLIIAWAAQQRRKLPFMFGAAGSVANVIGQVVIVFYGGTTLIKWLIFGSVGLIILLAAIFAERWIIPRAQEMRDRLEAWS